jgi:peptidoglycan/LPS O-acetylase OafA/YrhL
LFLVAMPVTLGFAVVSWHFIEKPALRLKKHIKPAQPKVLRNAET